MRIIQLFILGALLSFAAQADEITQVINNAKAATGVKASVGLIVTTLDNRVLVEHQADSYSIPASTTKTFLVAALIKEMPSNFRYITQLRYNASGGVARDLSLHMSGDPSFSTEDLCALIQELKNKGIQSIQGPIRYTDAAFEGPHYGPGWTLDSKHWYYSAPISGIMVNKNTIPVFIDAKKLHATLNLKAAAPYDKNIVIHSTVKGVSTEDSKHCDIDLTSDHTNAFTFSGCWGVNEPRTHFKIAVDDPHAYFEEQLRFALAQAGFSQVAIHNSHKGTLESGKSEYIIEHFSAPLDSFINQILTNSDNIVAESLYKQLGLHTYKEGSFIKGRLALNRFYQSLTKSEDELFLYDGSGQSRYSLSTARQLNNFLIACWTDPILKERIVPHLAQSGQTGTLESRLRHVPFRGKTGTMRGVRVITGYLGEENPLVVTIMIAKSITKDSAIPLLVDKLMRHIHKTYSPPLMRAQPQDPMSKHSNKT